MLTDSADTLSFSAKSLKEQDRYLNLQASSLKNDTV
jgi:hypothetical protein